MCQNALRLTPDRWHYVHWRLLALTVSQSGKTKLIRNIITGVIVILALAPQGKQVAQQPLQAPLQQAPLQQAPLQQAPPPPTLPPKGPLTMFLLSRPCANSGVGNWARRTEDVTVGKAFYTSRLFMGPGNRSASFTCRLQPNRANVIFQRLQLSFGMRDYDQGSPSATVNVYLDGVRAESRTVFPGRAESVSLDVTSTSNVSLETVCSSQGPSCARVHFWEAELEYPRLPPRKL